MEKKSLRTQLILITYTAFLLLTVLRLPDIWAVITFVIEAMSPFITGFAIAFVLTAPCIFFENTLNKFLPSFQKYSSGLAVALSYFAVIALIVGLVSVVIPKLTESVSIFTDSIKIYTANLQEWLSGLANKTDNEMLAEISVDLQSIFTNFSTYLEKAMQTALSTMSVAATQVISVTGDVVSVIINIVISLVFSVYMLADRKNLCRQSERVLFAYLPHTFAEKILFVLRMTSNTFSKFVAGQLLEACILGGLCAIGMLFIQPDYAMLIGIIVGTSALVPVAGGYVGGGFSFVLLFMVSPMSSVIFLVFLLVLQQFEGNVIYPRVVGNSIGLPGLWVVFAVIIGGALFGLLGVLLSVPCLSVLYALLRMDIQRREELQKTGKPSKVKSETKAPEEKKLESKPQATQSKKKK